MMKISASFLLVSATLLPAAEISLLPEKVTPAIQDRQDFQTPDRVQLGGWIGTRIAANEGNRLVKLDPDRLLEGYRHRPGRQSWDGEHVGKWLHAATLAWANTGDAALRQKLDLIASELIKCQLDDGYLGTYVETNRWTEWDVWAHKYNLIGLVTYVRFTGNLDPLPACRRMADLLCKTFGDQPGQRDIIKAGNHVGMAPTSVLEPMVLLYRLTGETRYLEFCKYILRAWEEPNGPKIISTLLTAKRVDKVGNGKAYEMLSCLNGALEYYRTTGDRQIFEACLNAWQDIVDHRLYITGTASYREFFHADFDLPNVNNVGETCVTVTWLQFNAQLLRLTGEARFADQLERTVLNQLLGAQSCDGSAWGYYVQMEGKKPYSSKLDGHCCLSSGPRGVALIPTFAATADEDGIVMNLYETGTARLKLRDQTPITLKTETRYPAEGEVRIAVSPASKKYFTIKLRVPAWCQSATVKLNGKPAILKTGTDGYTALAREWSRGDRVQLDFKLEPRMLIGDHKNEGKLAVLYGPLVLTADEAFLGEERPKLNPVGVADANLKDLHLRVEAARDDARTWPGAKVYPISAVARRAGTKEPDPLPIKLVPFADAGRTGSVYKVWLPYAPKSLNENLLKDGVEIRSRKPNAGSIIDDDFTTLAVTFNGKPAAQDWFGVELSDPVTIGRIVFAHGQTFHDGGWFDATAGKPRVQYKTTPDGAWQNMCELTNYPATTATESAGLKSGETFNCTLPKPISITALRVIGKPACGDNSKQAFSSCAELQAFSPIHPK